MAMKLSEQMRKSMDDAEDGLSFSFPVDAWANEVAQLEAELLKYKDIAHNINESFQLERTENAKLKREEEGKLFGRPIAYIDGLAGDDDLKLTFGGPLITTEVEELRERIALALDGIDNGYSTDYVRNILKDAS